MKVAILGCGGMLGAMVINVFAKNKQFNIVATYRDNKDLGDLQKKYPQIDFRLLDAEDDKQTATQLKDVDWVVNAIGVIKPYIHDNNPLEVERAIRINSLFPYRLASVIPTKTKIIQIATDCVYSGQKGAYVEGDPHDALDVYGKSKGLGEVPTGNFIHLRCSIIGPELKSHLSLLDWFLSQPKHAELNGFTNHQWNGITTLAFARICEGIIKNNLSIKHSQHVVPGNLISKADLLRVFAKAFGRSDLKIKSVKAPVVIDRTLSTNNSSLNKKIWQSAGYESPPTIQKMIAELASHEF